LKSLAYALLTGSNWGVNFWAAKFCFAMNEGSQLLFYIFVV